MSHSQHIAEDHPGAECFVLVVRVVRVLLYALAGRRRHVGHIGPGVHNKQKVRAVLAIAAPLLVVHDVPPKPAVAVVKALVSPEVTCFLERAAQNFLGGFGPPHGLLEADIDVALHPQMLLGISCRADADPALVDRPGVGSAGAAAPDHVAGIPVGLEGDVSRLDGLVMDRARVLDVGLPGTVSRVDARSTESHDGEARNKCGQHVC
ncbi:hypothetical protein PG985_007025 [Apiospora marii]|uniref:Uncharacterized protein n=1 Tax=Apiospora marii TaxID=335849 RepID=A0ABR1SGI0_9PEZI